MKKSWWVYGIIISLVFASAAVADEAEKIVTVFFDGGYPPFYMEDLKSGIYVDFIKEFDKQHPEFSFVLLGVSRKRIDKLMLEGKAQASALTNPMFVGKDAAEKFLFTRPLWKSGNYIMMRKDNMFTYAGPEDLFGKKLGVMYGNKNGILDPHIEAGRIEAIPIKTSVLLYKMLQKGSVDAIIANKHVAPYEMKQEGMDTSQFTFAEVALFEFDLMTQIQKTHPHVLEKLNEFITVSEQNGFLDEVVKKYLE